VGVNSINQFGRHKATDLFDELSPVFEAIIAVKGNYLHAQFIKKLFQ